MRSIVSTRLRRTAGLAIVLAALIGGSSGCASGTGAVATTEDTSEVSMNGDEESQFVDAKAIQAEYAQAASELELPPGFAFPAERDWDETGSYEQGCGVSVAQNYWKWAWITEWLEQRGVDPTREAKALDVLKNDVPSCWAMTEGCDDSVRQVYAANLEKAELGDPSGFQQGIDANHPDLIRTGE